MRPQPLIASRRRLGEPIVPSSLNPSGWLVRSSRSVPHDIEHVGEDDGGLRGAPAGMRR
jgi:hypothetical protein